MKKLTVITTIVLMFAFVLPMAQAQDKPSTENSSADSVQAAEQPSQTEETLETEQVENEPQTKEQLLQSKQALQTQLQQLDIEKQKIQQQLKALMQQAQYAKNNAAHAKMKAKEAALKAKGEKDKAEKAKASAEAAKAEAEAKKWEHWANSWVKSEEFKQWQKEMEQWGKEYAKAHENAISSDSDHISVPKPHPMPTMPPMPAHADFVASGVVVPSSTVAPVAPTVVIPKVMPHTKVESHIHDKNAVVHDDKDDKCVATKEMQFVAKVKPGIPFIVRDDLGNITLKPSKDDTCDVKAVIRAEAKTDAEAQEMVEKVSMNVESTDEKYYLKPVKPDGDKRTNINVDLYITVPVGVRPDVKTDLGNIDLSNLKGNIKAVTKLGNVKAVNTAGNVDLHTDLGNVEFISPKDLAGGDVKLVTNLGNIEFTAPRDLSAKLQAQAKMGEIKSELPLVISKPDMFKRTTEGTIGSGQANINMTTNMGKVNLKWQPSSQDETKL